MHYIQLHILDTLVHAKILRNRDMRPPRVESNLYQYHLQQLRHDGYVAKDGTSYFLTGRGLAYADRHSTTLKKTRSQPKLITTLFLSDESGRILLVSKSRQPFMGLYNLPAGKIHLDETVNDAAQREVAEKVSSSAVVTDMKHFGVAHMTIVQDDFVISDYVALLMSARIKSVALAPERVFINPSENLARVDLMPSVKELVAAYVAQSAFSEHIISLSDNTPD